MTGSLGEIIRALDRAIVPHDFAYYRQREQQAYEHLRRDQSKGLAIPVDQAGELGRCLQELLDELLAHPLCNRLNHKPSLYLHRDPEMPFGTFADVIVVPYTQVNEEKIATERGRRITKAVFAHELGHILNHDMLPVQQARNPHQHTNQRMERRADLIAAHLCGDGGAGLAEWLRDQESIRRYVERHQSWKERLSKELIRIVDRRYPAIEARIRYLDRWSEQYQNGKPLPNIDNCYYRSTTQSHFDRSR